MCSTMAQQQLPVPRSCAAQVDTVGGGHDGSEPWSGDVVAFVLAGATVAVGTERRADLAHSDRGHAMS